MTASTGEPHRRDAAAFAQATEAAGRAPSIHNTQPWRWRASDATVTIDQTGR